MDQVEAGDRSLERMTWSNGQNWRIAFERHNGIRVDYTHLLVLSISELSEAFGLSI